MAALKADRLQIFIQTGLDGGQSRNPCTNHSHPLNHNGEYVRPTAVRTLMRLGQKKEQRWERKIMC